MTLLCMPFELYSECYETRILQNGDVSVSYTFQTPILHRYSWIRAHEVS